jgi:hypothetical protein
MTMNSNKPQSALPINTALEPARATLSVENTVKRQPGYLSLPENRSSHKTPLINSVNPPLPAAEVDTESVKRDVPPPYRFTKPEHGPSSGGSNSLFAPYRNEGQGRYTSAGDECNNDDDRELYYGGKKQWKSYNNAKQVQTKNVSQRC